MEPIFINDTNKIIRWLLLHGNPIATPGSPEGAVRTKLRATSEGEYLALGVCTKNMKVPPHITRALDTAVELWTRFCENSARFSGSIPEAQQKNKEHRGILNM